MLNNEKDIISAIQEDEWMMEILKAAKTLNLPDWWVCAGFVRSKVWDVLHHFIERTPLADVDVIYFDSANIEEFYEKELEKKLITIHPDIPWSVKNQARMHLKSNTTPYHSSVDAISKFPETVTALGVKLDEKDNVILTAPHGVRDVLHLEVHPTPDYREEMEKVLVYEERVKTKNWPSNWDKVQVNHLLK